MNRPYNYPDTRQNAAFAATQEIGAPPPPSSQGDPAQNLSQSARDRYNPTGQYIEVPAFYNIVVENLGNVSGDTKGGSVQIRPEDFIVERITWAAMQDVLFDELGFSFCGRTCEIAWGDEFTRFLNRDPALITAAFGDSNGFLDFPNGIRFQGKQTLSLNLRRVFGDVILDAIPGRFDFVFHGFGLLPRGSGGYSGGAL
jgi:hypothetical protein